MRVALSAGLALLGCFLGCFPLSSFLAAASRPAAVPIQKAAVLSPEPLPRARPLFGALQSEPERAAQNFRAGLRLATLEIGWNRCEPREGSFDAVYLAQRQARLRAFQAAGMQVVLDLGLQYPPSWIFAKPHSRYINQYGDAFNDPAPGMNGVNAVWNEQMRRYQAAYVGRVFATLGTGFFAVRMGWGWYSELNFPRRKFNEHTNSYWAFDAIAQGKAPGLPPGMAPCPLPGWVPGTSSPQHRAASLFANWYLNGLKNYHDWQIGIVRRHYAGRLTMLYPSWGIRPGQLDAALAVDLDGSTSAEKNGEVPAGLDFARFVAGISDPKVIVYTTWIDAPVGDDNSRDPAQWTPAHYLAYLAAANPLNLQVWGENTGNGDIKALERSVQRVRDYGLGGLMWAFEGQLYDGRHATLAQYGELIDQAQR